MTPCSCLSVAFLSKHLNWCLSIDFKQIYVLFFENHLKIVPIIGNLSKLQHRNKKKKRITGYVEMNDSGFSSLRYFRTSKNHRKQVQKLSASPKMGDGKVEISSPDSRSQNPSSKFSIFYRVNTTNTTTSPPPPPTNNKNNTNSHQHRRPLSISLTWRASWEASGPRGIRSWLPRSPSWTAWTRWCSRCSGRRRCGGCRGPTWPAGWSRRRRCPRRAWPARARCWGLPPPPPGPGWWCTSPCPPRPGGRQQRRQ